MVIRGKVERTYNAGITPIAQITEEAEAASKADVMATEGANNSLQATVEDEAVMDKDWPDSVDVEYTDRAHEPDEGDDEANPVASPVS